MSERAKIEDRLRRKEAEILGFEEKIKAGRIYIQALRDVLKMLSDEPESSSSEGAGDKAIKAGSAVAQARDAIMARGTPMHINALLAAMGREQNAQSRASLIGSISAYVRRGEIFTRPLPNTFGLLELGHVTDESEEGDEPPIGFGGPPPTPEDDEDDPFYVKDSP